MRAVVVCVAVLPILLGVAPLAAAPRGTEDRYDAQWIWYDFGNPAENAPVGKVWFRRELRADEPSTGAARVVCDDRFTMWVNGRLIGHGEGGKLYRFNLNGIVERGPNVIAVEAENLGGKAGLFVDGDVRSQGGHSIPFDTGSGWLATRTAPQGTAWLEPKFEGTGWKPVKVIGPHEKSPWKEIVLKDTYLDRFDVPHGFELLRVAEPKLVGSLIAMTWGNRGRLIVSRERGPILSAIDDNGDGIYDRVVEYTKAVKNCQGLCTVGDDLYAVGDGPKGVGLYRLADKNHDDKADSVELIVRHRGGMGDHGPHDVVFGPDGWLYHNVGNHTAVRHKAEENSAARNWAEEDLLAPKFEDAGGHAAGIKAPGGTIWRFTPDGKRWWCETSGFRNEYDFAFNTAGDLFSFDSDMEWDVGAYWYRPIRVTHCTPGAEFGWRSGAAKWPAYYFDSLPAAVDIGRGSPTGVIFYDHRQFPEKYRGVFICSDWSMGRILAVHLKKTGATFTGTFETILSGNPLNVSDIEIGRDGSIVFVTGGRSTEGGIYRLSYKEIYRLSYKEGDKKPADATDVAGVLALPQIESAWSREIAARVKQSAGAKWNDSLVAAARSGKPADQLRALTLLSQLGPRPELKLLLEVSIAKDPTVRAFVTHLLGFREGPEVRSALIRLLSDVDPMVRRRACESFVRSGIEPPVKELLPLIGSDDRWLRFAARLALERVPREKWSAEALASTNLHVVCEALLGLYRGDRHGFAETLVDRSAKILTGPNHSSLSTEMRLTALRLAQLGLSQGVRNGAFAQMGAALLAHFPTGEIEVDAEMARILAALNLEGAAAKILPLVETARTNGEQLHFALTLSYLKVGWNLELERRLMRWYGGTRDWEGGNSLTGYVSNIVSSAMEKFSPQDRHDLLVQWDQFPVAAALLVRVSRPDQVADYESLLSKLIDQSGKKPVGRQEELISAAIGSLGKSRSGVGRSILQKLYEEHPDRRETIARAIADNPIDGDWPLLVRTLQFADDTTLQLCLGALSHLDRRPENADPFRTVIQAGLKLRGNGGLGATGVLQKWTGADAKAGRDAAKSLAFYQKWYSQKFPSAPAPELPKDDASKSKYSFQQIAGLVGETGRGDAELGRAVFTKAKCVKCHRFQNEGESLGPDLTSVRRRFQRKEIIESVVFPSQVISDQYRMVQILTTDGLVYAGMPVSGAAGKGKVVLLLSDATKLEIPKSRIEEQNPSKISVMPTGLLDSLSLKEIADLFAFLETSKFNAPVADAGRK